MRRPFALAFALLVVGLICLGLTPARRVVLSGKKSFVIPGASLAFNFRTLQAWTTSGGFVTPASLLNVSRALTAYAPDTSGNWYSFANNTLRMTNTGLWNEESRANGIQASNMQGAVVGTPGTLPFNSNYGWSDIAADLATGGIVGNIVGTGTENGINYIDVQFAGTSGASGNGQLSGIAFGGVLSGGAGAIAGVQGNTFSVSAFMTLKAGSLTNVNAIQFNIDEHSSSAYGYLVTDSGTSFKSSLVNAPLGLNRYTQALTMTNASCAYIDPWLYIQAAPNSAVNFTLRIGWPQNELGAFATTPIVTSTAALTRPADAISFKTPSLVPNGAATIFVEFATGNGFTPSTPVSIYAGYDNTFSNVAELFAGNSYLQDLIYTGGTNTVLDGLYSATLSANTTYRAAMGWGGGTVDISAPASLGTSPTVGNSAAPAAAFQQGYLGYDGNSSHHFNGPLRSFTVFPFHQPTSVSKAWAQGTPGS